MDLSLIAEIAIKQTPTEAWTKRFEVTTKNPNMPLPPVPSNHIFRFGQNDWNRNQVLTKAQEFVGNWFQQELLANLSSYIKDQVTGKEPLGFTLVEAAKVPGEQNQQSASWKAKGSGYISQDVEAAVAALGKSMGVEPSSMRTRSMTLLYPLSYNGLMYKVQKQIEHSLPKLELKIKDDLVTNNHPFALLLCNDEAATKIGTFECHNSIQLFFDEKNPGLSPYILAFPSYSFTIFAPEQIAVLTGI